MALRLASSVFYGWVVAVAAAAAVPSASATSAGAASAGKLLDLGKGCVHLLLMGKNYGFKVVQVHFF